MAATLHHVASLVLNRPLLLLPGKLATIAAVLDGRIGIDASELRPGPDASQFVGSAVDADPVTGARTGLPYRRTSAGVAIIPVLGSLVNRGAWIGASSGLTSYEGLNFALNAAASDPRTRSVLLDMDSPGGEAVGCFEAAAAVRQLAARKPVTAVVNGMAASAAYAIASAATRIVTTSSGISGSIGVVMLHADYSGALAKAGVKPTLIFAGAHKVDGNPYEALPESVRESLQAEIETFYSAFVSCVAAGRRNLSAEAIRGTEARTFIGANAVAAGLADQVGTFETALADLSAGRVTLATPQTVATAPAAAATGINWDATVDRINAKAGHSRPAGEPGFVARAMAAPQATVSSPPRPAPASAGAIDWDALAAEHNAKDGMRRNETTGMWERGR